MNHKGGWLFAWSLLIASACGGGDDGEESGGGSYCQKLCKNEAQLECPSGTLEGCMTGCQMVFDEIDDMKPDCVDERDATFACTSTLPLSSIHCDPDTGRPKYDDTCLSQNVAFVECQDSNVGAQCEGAADDGTCHAVECPCPSGPTAVSGFTNGAGGCTCLNTTTCLDECP